ncbi:hypothetical protein Q3G72_005853 [Acer saccharum]|nr:hypothetical protein Q3G72_005853 [Acer saccharum]
MLALGGFRRLHSLYLRQLSKRPRSGLNWAPPMIGSKSSTRCGRDKVHLSLPLLSPVDPNLVSPEEVDPPPMTKISWFEIEELSCSLESGNKRFPSNGTAGTASSSMAKTEHRGKPHDQVTDARKLANW